MRAIRPLLVRLAALALVSLVSLVPLAVATAAPAAAPPAPASAPAPAPAALYALALEKLLARAGAEAVYVLPSAAASDLHVRARRASGPARTASAATAREVVALLRRRGAPGVRGTRERLAPDGALQVVLGELRFEPESSPTFARLRVGVVGADGARQTLDFLLKREGARWRALNMEAADNIGMRPANASAVAA